MEKKLCCPNCRSMELKFPDSKDGYEQIECLNCEYEFYGEEILTKIIDKNEIRFNIAVILFVVFLVFGMYLSLAYSCLNYGVSINWVVKPLLAIGFNQGKLLIFGLVFFMASFFSLFLVFELRRYISILREKRKYIRNNCYEDEA